jgi:uncharacterized protein YkwD
VLKRPQAARLLAVDRDAGGTRLLLLTRGEAAVGNAEGCALRVGDPNVAARHAIVRYARGRYYLEDLKSGEGTFLNGKRIRRTQRLKHGDVLRFGSALPYRFIDPDAQKRRRWRRNLRLTATLAVLVAFGWVDHREGWGVVSVATLSKIVALVESNQATKQVAPPVAVAVHSPAQPKAARSAIATNLPGPAEYARNIAASATPHAAPTPPATANLSVAAPSSWIDRINFYRRSNGLASIHDNPELSAGAAAHAHYLLLNFGDDIRNTRPMGGDAYEEKPDKSGYSAAGAAAAPNLDLEWGCSSYDATQQIDRLMEGPFHRLAILDPYLEEAGFGQASQGGCWVAALRLPPPPEEVKPYPRAIEFPPDAATVSLDWIGVESPDPLASCPGYERPVGLPITLQIGPRIDTKLTAHSFMADGKPIEHCIFDAPSYLNEDPKAQEYGRWHLRNAGAIVIVPRAPLQPGVRYSVSIGAHDTTYAWSFTVTDGQDSTFASVAPFPTPAAEATIVSSPPPRRSVKAAHRTMPAPAASTIALNNPAAAAPASSEIPPGEASTSSNWLEVLNSYRTRLSLPPIVEDPVLSRGCLEHAKYLIANYGSMMAHGGSPGASLHQEAEAMRGYSPDGLKAAQASDVVYHPRNGMTQDELMEQAVEWWMSEPFHRPQLLNPQLRSAGFGQYCGETGCVSVLNSISGAAPAPYAGRLLDRPIEIPPDGATVKAQRFGGEWPSPVSSCAGYSPFASAITLQIGLNVSARIDEASLTQTSGSEAGTKVDTCAYDSDTYTNPNSADQVRGREVLKSFGQVVMMVRDPFTPGETYRADVAVNGKRYTWSFTAAR